MYIENNTIKNQISIWLIYVFLIALMIVIGGLTRLTDSGLSITQWELFSGIFPPFNKMIGLIILNNIKKYQNLNFKILQ